MKKVTLLPIIILLLTFSCNDKEKQQQKERALSNLDILQKNVEIYRSNIEILKRNLTDAKGNLEVAKHNIDKAKEFQFMRSATEKTKQIKDATAYKISVEENIQEIEKSIIQNSDSLNQTSFKIETLKEFLKN